MPKVLIIEDEPNMVLGLRDSCEYEGYEVAVARDGAFGPNMLPGLMILPKYLP